MINMDYNYYPISGIGMFEIPETFENKKVTNVAKSFFSQVPVAEVTSALLKTKALAVVSIKIAMETLSKSFMHTGMLALGALLLPVNLIAMVINGIMLRKDLLEKKYAQALSKFTALLGSLSLSITGAALIHAYLLPAVKVMASAAFHVAKIAGPVGVFLLAATHIIKVANHLYALYHAKDAAEKKEIMINLIHDLVAAVGLILLGLILLGALGAHLATPAGWVTLGILLVALVFEVAHTIYKQRSNLS